MSITPGDAHWWEGRITRGEAVRRATLGLVDLIPGDTWDTTVNQPGREGIMVVYSGGRRGATYPTTHAHGPAPPALARETVERLATVYPHLDREHVRAGRQGGVHFAGEHTDTDQQGYIDGAVRTGERAAREVIAR